MMGRVEYDNYYDMEDRVGYGPAFWVRAMKVGCGICWESISCKLGYGSLGM